MAPAPPSPTSLESGASEPRLGGWRLPGRPSLARRIQWQMGALMLVAIAAMTTWSYRNTVEQVLSSTQEALRSTLAVRSQRDSVLFEHAQQNTVRMREDFVHRLRDLDQRDPQAEVDRWFVRYPDGLLRVRPELDDHRRLPSVYLRPSVALSPDLRRRLWAAFETVRSWGPALTTRYYAAYIDLPDEGLIMFSPSVNWGALADPTTNNHDYPPVRNSAPDRNPQRRTLWSEPYYDDKAAIWMVSAVTPVDIDGRWIASVSQDVSIDELTRHTIDDSLPSAYNLIMDQAGRLLAHPTRMAQIRATGGALPAAETGDSLLVEMASLLGEVGEGTLVRRSTDGRYLLGFAQLSGPDWHLVTVYPVQAARALAVDNAQGIVVVGALVALLGVALLVAILRSQVGQPLSALIGATEHLEGGRLDVRVPESGRHELARLGQSFNRMAERIESRDRQLTQLARQDALTGLPNRFHLLGQLAERIVQCRTSGGRLALIYIDLDRFKSINDALGHSVGDELLQRVAALFLAQARGEDFVARLGGDEFVVLVHDPVDVRRGAERLAARLVEALRSPIEVAGFTLHTTPSLGISLFPDDAEDAETLVRKADIAMYRAKAEGRNGWRFYEPVMDDIPADAIETGNALRQAFARQEFVLHYQPKVRLADRRIVGCEALVRWDRPDHGLVAPGLFLPLLQEIGLMPELNRHVLEAACAQLGAWQRAGQPVVPMAINLTPDFCLQPGMAQAVLAACQRHDVAPGLLEIEIVETTLLEELSAVQQNLHALRQRGVRIAVDDFGTGYSALSYLHRFAIDDLKIDRSFVSLIGERRGDAPMTRAIALIGRGLSLGVIAEGVETEHQAQVLQTHGCEFAQGYLFGRPAPADALQALLASEAAAAARPQGSTVGAR